VDTSEQMTIEGRQPGKKEAEQVGRRKATHRRRGVGSRGVGSTCGAAVFYWRKKYHEGQLGKGPSSKLVPVTLSDSTCGKSASWSSAVRSLEIKLSKGTVRVAGNVDVVMLRTAIESLLG